jgi:hypothetical protein
MCLGERGCGEWRTWFAPSTWVAFTVEKNTLREAKESAKSLRERGFWVIIIGPDGKTLDDETQEDP